MNDWFARAKRAISKRSLSLAQAKRHDRANLYRRMFAFETLEPRLTLAAAGLVTTPQTYSGTLSGKIVYTSGGHGFNGYNTNNIWHSERPDYWETTGDTSDGDIVEDLGNQDQMTLYADYLLRAGATVVPMRPVGRQTNEVVLDNEFFVNPQPSKGTVTFTGSWSNTTDTRYYDADYGAVADSVPSRKANTTTGAATAFATYTPIIPQAGLYPVYTWVHFNTDRTSQLYTINHTDGSTQIRVNHSQVGDGWVYLGTYHFNAGSSTTDGSVVISNDAAATGKVVIADAIRFGNGMGDLAWGSGGIGTGNISGMPREDEYSTAWVWRGIGQGVNPATIFNSTTSPYTAPAIMAGRMNSNSNPFGTSVYVGFHSNGGSGLPTSSGRGALGLYRSASDGNATPNQLTLATDLGAKLNTDMPALNGQFEYNWATTSSNVLSGAYAEISNAYYNSEMDATIIEVAYHDNQFDNALLRDPKVRDQIARSVYEGTLQYFTTYGAANAALPSAPTNVRAVSNASGEVTISWAAGPSSGGGYSGVYGDVATGYKVYASVDGYGFDGGRTVSGVGTTTLTITGLDTKTPYYFKVTATNDGGESEPSEVVTALPTGGVKQVLIVNGFDRFDRLQDFKYPYTQSGYSTPDPDGSTNRVWPRYNNSHDYVVQVETAIQAAKPGIHVASTSDEAVTSGAVNLTDFNTVIYITGNQSSASTSPPGATSNYALDPTEQSKLTSFINAGGNLFVSGSEIAWDLDHQNHGRTFYQTTLGASYVADDANTYTATAAAGGIFAGMSSIGFSNGSSFSQLDGQLYDVATPDVIAPQTGAVSALTYSAGTGGTAAIQKQGTGGKGSIVMFGFPFETITSASQRQTAMGKILDFFGVAAPLNADFNGDSIVDAGDYIIWRKNNGITSGATHSQGDANSDGAVNNTDYDIWRAQFGTSPGSGAGAMLLANGAAQSASESPNTTLAINSVGGSQEQSGSAAQQAAFSALATTAGDHWPTGAAKRKNLPDRSLLLEQRNDWTALLTSLAERKVRTDTMECEATRGDDSSDGQLAANAEPLALQIKWRPLNDG